jgi:two-component system, chemotaxis family, protein-glutamate methylesterase/glutaminase
VVLTSDCSVKRSRPIRVLIVDDSALVRKMLSAALEVDTQIEVVGTAPDPYIARDKILELSPDVLTLDIEMPRMDGITFLKKLMQYKPLPVIVISSLGSAACQASLEALRAGAVEILAKPNGPYSVGELGQTLAAKIHTAFSARLPVFVPGHVSLVENSLASTNHYGAPVWQGSISYRRNSIIAIGASTGGPEAVAQVLQQLPKNVPPILVVQHMPAVFTQHFAQRLDRLCQIEVKEAEDGDELLPGRALVAPGNFHMMLRDSETGRRVRIDDGPPVCYSRPSVDVLFSSVARIAGRDGIGVLLTGMGGDGARGLLQMRDCGGATFAQSEETCVVFGMPREAIQIGAVQATLPLNRIADAILRQLTKAKDRTASLQVATNVLL